MSKSVSLLKNALPYHLRRIRQNPLKFIAAGGFIGVGLYELPGVINSFRSANFKRTVGEITSSGIRDGKPIIKYTYEVDGIKYHGRRVTYNDDINALHGAFVAGDERAVYYNPSNPHEACLEKGNQPIKTTKTLIFFLGGIVWYLL